MEPQAKHRPSQDQRSEPRRRFLARGWPLLGWGGVAAFGLGSGAATLGFFFPRALLEPPSAFSAGHPEEFATGEVSERFVKQHRVWIVRTWSGLYALQAQCTHLGCTPAWFSEERLFKCPCHGSNFNIDGDAIAGPAPEPLRRLAVRLDEEGRIVVDSALSENRKHLRERSPFLLRL